MVGGVAAFASGLRLGRTANSIVAAPVDGLASDSVEFFRIDEDGSAADRIAAVPGAMSTQFMIGGQLGSRFALFSPVPLDGNGGDCVYITSAAEPVVAIVHSSGRAIGRIVLPIEQRRVESAHRRAWIDATAEEAGMPEGSPERSMIEQLGTQIRAAEHLPFFNDLIVDELGYVWLQLYEPPAGNSREWMVLDGDGRQLGRMQLPVAGDVLHISADRVAVKWVEETGEEILRIYSLARGNETASVVPDACRL